MTLAEGTPNEIDWLMEQVDACHDIAHTYTCAICEDRQGKEPVLLVQDLPEGEARVIIITVCKDCLPQVKGISHGNHTIA
jgi:hypothetical protein